MKDDIKISINPLAEFSSATPGKRRAIIKQSKNIKPFIVAYYRTARNRIKKYFENGFSLEEIVNGINYLQGKDATTSFQKSDKKSSIEALRKFLELQFPDNFKNLKCRFLKINDKELLIEGVKIKIAPDIILEFEKDGKKYVGGIKFHISKSLFNLENTTIVATGLKLYLEEKVANDSCQVDVDYCIAVDIFSERITKAPRNHEKFLIKLKKTCAEVKEMWDVA